MQQCTTCNGSGKKRVGPDPWGHFYRVVCDCKKLTGRPDVPPAPPVKPVA